MERMRTVMDNKQNIRNIALIVQGSKEETNLTDALLARANPLDQADDTCKDEHLEGITIKSTARSLYYDLDPAWLDKDKERSLLVNMADSPPYVDFDHEVISALRVADGALVVVDFIEGVSVQTEAALIFAAKNLIKIVLLINSLDRAVFELQLTAEEIYQSVQRIVESVNVILATYCDNDEFVDPSRGNVAFGSGLHGWGFNLLQFAEIYAAKFKIVGEKLVKRLWGDNFFNPREKKWKKEKEDGYERGSITFALEPVMTMLKACKENDRAIVDQLTAKLNLRLSEETLALEGEALMKAVMQKWLPASDAMLRMIVDHLPSPDVAQLYRTDTLYEGPSDDPAAIDKVLAITTSKDLCSVMLRMVGDYLPSPDVAQRYRTDTLYEGPSDDPTAIGMKNCDSEGPLIVSISKMVPTSNQGQSFAVGRIFSGKVSSGMKVRIMGPDYNPDDETDKDLYVEDIERVVILMGGNGMAVDDVPCGNIVALVGIDKSSPYSYNVLTHFL